MDRDELREATDHWVEDGIITSDQAAQILARYEEAEDGFSRTVLALSLMGATLFGIGVVLILAINWEDIPRWLGTLIVVTAPPVFGAMGFWLRDGRAPRVGHALWLLGAAFVGPSLILLPDLWNVEIAEEWILLGWAAVAVPAGHAAQSRPTTALGLVVVSALVIMLSTPANILATAGLFGVVLLGIGLYHQRLDTAETPIGPIYRFVGVSTVIVSLIAALIGLSAAEAISVTPLLAILAIAAVGAVVAVAWYVREASLERSSAVWIGTLVAAVALTALLVTVRPSVPEIAAILGIHAGLLAVLFTTVVAAMGLRSTSLVNLVVLAFLGQVLLFLTTTLPDALPTEVVLIVTGLVMLGIGLALERGRRQVLERIEP